MDVHDPTSLRGKFRAERRRLRDADLTEPDLTAIKQFLHARNGTPSPRSRSP